MKVFIIGLIAVAVVGGGGYLVIHKSPSKMPATTNNQSQSASSSINRNAADTITFDGSQFSPASLSVKSGTMVTIKNTSSQDVEMDSNPHPVHTDDTDLNVGLVSPGQSKTFTVTKTGTFGYHDHLQPSIQSKITIE